MAVLANRLCLGPLHVFGRTLPGEGANVCLSGVPALLLEWLLALLLSLLPVPALVGLSVAGLNSSSCTAISGMVGGVVLRRERGREEGGMEGEREGRREGGEGRGGEGRKREGREGEGEEGGGGGRSGSGELTRTKCSYTKVIALFPNSHYHTATQHTSPHVPWAD